MLARCGPGGLKLGKARELLAEAKKALAAGRSPARQKASIRKRRKDENTFGQWTEEWLERYMMAESTRDMRRSVYECDLKKPYQKLKLDEITEEELRRLCDRIVARGAPATAVQARESLTRQVIVFTYDIYFLCILEQKVNEVGAQLTKKYIRKTAQGFGVHSEQLPFDVLSTKDRLGRLKQTLVLIRKAQQEGNDDEYRQLTTACYGRLRLA